MDEAFDLRNIVLHTSSCYCSLSFPSSQNGILRGLFQNMLSNLKNIHFRLKKAVAEEERLALDWQLLLPLLGSAYLALHLNFINSLFLGIGPMVNFLKQILPVFGKECQSTQFLQSHFVRLIPQNWACLCKTDIGGKYRRDIIEAPASCALS